MPTTHQKIAECALNLGEIKVFNTPGIITCFGLGSCIGLFLYDRVHKVGGGAHIMLPTLESTEACTGISKCSYANHAIETLLVQMNIKGSNVDGLGLRAKLVGGANLFEGGQIQIGKKNITAVLEQLLTRKIYVASTDVGGTQSRTARFYTETGNVEINTSSYTYFI